MSILNHSAHHIPQSATLAMSEKAALLKKQGKDVINLSVGEPDLFVPQWIREAAIKAIQEGSHLYTPISGLPELRQAVIQKLERENDLPGYALSNVIVSNGAKQVLHNALMVSVEHNQEVIIPAPYWVSYPTMVTMAGGKPVVLPCTEDTQFKLTAKSLRAAITPLTRWVILNSPSNPTGAVYSRTELREIADVLIEHPHVWILSDDIYEHLVYSPYEFASILNVEPALRDRTLLVNGLSKSFAMTGWRIGYGVGPVELIEAMIRFQSHSTSGGCCISQWAAVAALNDPQAASFLAEQTKIFQNRRDVLVSGLSSFVHAESPQGAFYVYANVSELIKDKKMSCDSELAHSFLVHTLVSCVPGIEFGLTGYIRFSYAVEEKILEKAVDRLNAWVKKG